MSIQKTLANILRKIFDSKTLIILFVALIFSMYQETSAQNSKNKNQKPTAMTVETKTAAPEINYTVSMSKPYTHLLEVEMRLKSMNLPAQAEIKMPVWTPGSYLIREYARHVQDFDVKNASGNDLAWRKISKNTWQIDTKGANEIVVKYNIYANELTVRTNELNADHAFFTNAAVLMFPKDNLQASSTIKVVPFGDWKVATGLPKVDGQTNTFRAENFDILYDSPFEVGNYTEVPFTVDGIPHRFIIEGDGNYDTKRIAEDTAKIVQQAKAIFGELPYKDYTFILNLRGGGGLEHLNSTALQWQRLGFKPEARYKAFLNLVAHEYFHLWNVKRIRPDALGPFDYEKENYTRNLWIAEGGTAYYEAVLLRRANLISEKDFLDTKVSVIKALQNRPGRFETSLEDASFDAWIKYYRQDENSINNQISYYDKGELVNFLLDIEIRTASNGTKSLDDVMRYLYNEFYKKGKNYAPADYQKISEMMAGKSLEDFFEKYVRGTAEIDYDSILKGIGLKLVVEGKDKKQAYLGANLVETDGKLTVRSLPSDTPAYQQGLNTDDQIVAIDGNRASLTFLQTYLSQLKSGDKVKLTIFRFDTLRELDITLGEQANQNYSIVPVENPSDDQKRLYKQYLLADLE